MAKANPDVGYEPDPGKTLPWIGILLPPIAWAMQMQAVWLTTEWGCASTDFKWNHVASVAGIVLSVTGTIVAWQQYPGGAWKPAKEQGTPEVRRRFMAILGIVLGLFFTVVIIAQWLPTLMSVPCNK